MEIKFLEDKNCVDVIFEDPEKNIEFDLNKEVKLNEFIKFISDFEHKILINPKSYDEFVNGTEPTNKEAYKLVEYLYKILESFNESYMTVYESEKTGS